MTSRPSISDEITTIAGIGSAIALHARNYGIDIAPICRTLGIDPATFDSLTARVSLDRLCRLLETCALLADDEAFGLKSVTGFVPGASGSFGYGPIAAPTVRDFVNFLAEHTWYATNASVFRVSGESENGEIILSWTFPPVIARRDQYVDLSLALMLRRLRSIAGQEIEQISIGLERARPSRPAIFRELLVRKLEFSCRVNTIHFPARILDIANPAADARLFRLMDLQCRALRPEAPAEGSSFVMQVRKYIELHVARNDISLAEIAPYFNLSERTFQRRLAESGTTINELRDETRKEISHKLLTESDLSINDICYRLGYSAPSAFSRSVARWFGRSPRDLRGHGVSNYH